MRCFCAMFTGLLTTTILVAQNATPAPAAEPLQQGLIGYWAFDDQDLSITVDQAGDNDLDLVGAGRVKGILGGALFFDGAVTYAKRDQLHGPFPAKAGQELPTFTLTAWVRLSPADHRHPIVTKEGNLRRGFLWTVERDGRLAAHFWSERLDQKSSVTSRGEVPRSAWSHLAITFASAEDGPGRVRLYIDGELDGQSDSIPLPLAANDLPLEIGRIAWSQAYVRHMFGRIDELRLYDRELPPEEVAQLASQPADP